MDTEQPLGVNELYVDLQSSEQWKAPGIDGLPVDGWIKKSLFCLTNCSYPWWGRDGFNLWRFKQKNRRQDISSWRRLHTACLVGQLYTMFHNISVTNSLSSRRLRLFLARTLRLQKSMGDSVQLLRAQRDRAGMLFTWNVLWAVSIAMESEVEDAMF